MNRGEQKKPEDLKTRTKAFALRIIKLYVALPKHTEAQVMGKQVLRSNRYSRHLRQEGKGMQEVNSSFILSPSSFQRRGVTS